MIQFSKHNLYLLWRMPGMIPVPSPVHTLLVQVLRKPSCAGELHLFLASHSKVQLPEVFILFYFFLPKAFRRAGFLSSSGFSDPKESA